MKDEGMLLKNPRKMPDKITNNLMQIRYDRKFYKQKAFAAFLGISPQTLGLWERNQIQPSVASAIKICKLLDIEVGELYNLLETPELNK